MHNSTYNIKTMSPTHGDTSGLFLEKAVGTGLLQLPKFYLHLGF